MFLEVISEAKVSLKPLLSLQGAMEKPCTIAEQEGEGGSYVFPLSGKVTHYSLSWWLGFQWGSFARAHLTAPPRDNLPSAAVGVLLGAGVALCPGKVHFLALGCALVLLAVLGCCFGDGTWAAELGGIWGSIFPVQQAWGDEWPLGSAEGSVGLFQLCCRQEEAIQMQVLRAMQA